MVHPQRQDRELSKWSQVLGGRAVEILLIASIFTVKDLGEAMEGLKRKESV